MATLLSNKVNFDLFTKKTTLPSVKTESFAPKSVQLFKSSSHRVQDKTKQLAQAIVGGVDHFNMQSTLQQISEIIENGNFVSFIQNPVNLLSPSKSVYPAKKRTSNCQV
ncbi:MAG: hypothetical protein LBC20_00830 [Planctomycetaceae bacterium]|jgi:hypothetical protein|nr:hypothetical protein [Planctomycetaceae bacterium]